MNLNIGEKELPELVVFHDFHFLKIKFSMLKLSLNHSLHLEARTPAHASTVNYLEPLDLKF